eukprot:TRINITY_DN19088_c0_g1_i2.p1 TRINITY_DN19088_c0_g1~~TRINITY_DN19088_c0_g1_i2.p1  ORF type:complete len:500 (+),score=153.91 TRINITY_DN19088_c0_g1_i2:43-1542(+)
MAPLPTPPPMTPVPTPPSSRPSSAVPRHGVRMPSRPSSAPSSRRFSRASSEPGSGLPPRPKVYVRQGTPPPAGAPPTPDVKKATPDELKRLSTKAIGYAEIEKGTEQERREVQDLVYEHWNDVNRIRKNLDLASTGCIPASAFCTAAAQELALRRDKDSRILAAVVLDCLFDANHVRPRHPLAFPGEGSVDFEQLWEAVQRPKKGLDWKKRFRAQGIMPQKLQKQTTGVDSSTRAVYDGPPYAVCRDGDHMKTLVKEYFLGRCNRMREQLMVYGAHARPGYLTTQEFKKAMFAMEKSCANERELDALVEVMDRKKTGFVCIDDFLDRFALEYLKGRSQRVSMGKDSLDGDTHTLQWPSSMLPAYRKRDVMEDLRRKTIRKRKVAGSRSSTLRKRWGKQARETMSASDAMYSITPAGCAAASPAAPASSVNLNAVPSDLGSPHTSTAWWYVRPSAHFLGNRSQGPQNVGAKAPASQYLSQERARRADRNATPPAIGGQST